MWIKGAGAFKAFETDITWSFQKITVNHPWHRLSFPKWLVLYRVPTPLFCFLFFESVNDENIFIFLTYYKKVLSVIWCLLDICPSFLSFLMYINTYFTLGVPTLNPHWMRHLLQHLRLSSISNIWMWMIFIMAFHITQVWTNKDICKILLWLKWTLASC